MSKVIELRQRRAKCLSDAREILNRAESEKRKTTGEEDERYGRFLDEFRALGTEIEREEELNRFESELRTVDETRISTAVDESAEDPESRDNGDRFATPEHRDDGMHPATREYRNAFYGWMRNPNQFDRRALQVGTNSEGGYTVPASYERTVIALLREENIMRQICKVIKTKSTQNLPSVASNAVAGWITEEGAFGGTDAAFGNVQLGAHKAGAIVKISDELMEDSGIDMEEFVTSQHVEAIAALEETAFVNGDGSNKPTGVLDSSTLGKTFAATNAITGDELLDLYHSLGIQYRRKASWVVHDDVILMLSKLKELATGGNQYLYAPGLREGEPDILRGRPVYVSNNCETPDTASNKPILFGDFKYYIIADRGAMTMKYLGELYAANGQVAFRAHRRTEGKLSRSVAIVHGKMAAS